MMSKALIPIEQKQVEFYEDRITAVLVQYVNDENEIFVPVRPMCERLGIDWASQYRKLKKDTVLSEKLQGVVVMTTPSADGRGGGVQEMVCLPLKILPGWLFGINDKRVKPEIREQVIRYKRECYDALWDAFQERRLTSEPTLDLLLQQDSPAAQAVLMAQAVLKLARQQLLMESRLDGHESRLETIETEIGRSERYVTRSQAMEISQAVKAVALQMSHRSGRNEFGGIYGELYRQFEITSYKELPASRFEEALSFLSDWHQNLVGVEPF